MENKNNISENLENEAPFLAQLKKENHFTTPKNYFEVLPELINNKKLNNKSLNFSFDKLSYRILVPALSLIVISFFIFNNYNTPTETQLSNEEISSLLIEENYVEIDDYLVYETYSEINYSESEPDEYIDYLIENDIHINTIVEEL